MVIMAPINCGLGELVLISPKFLRNVRDLVNFFLFHIMRFHGLPFEPLIGSYIQIIHPAIVCIPCILRTYAVSYINIVKSLFQYSEVNTVHCTIWQNLSEASLKTWSSLHLHTRSIQAVRQPALAFMHGSKTIPHLFQATQASSHQIKAICPSHRTSQT